MQKKRMTIGTYSRDSGMPQYTDGRCVLSVPVIAAGDEQDIELAERMRKQYLNQRANEVTEECAALSVSQMEQLLAEYHAANLSELVYGFVTASEQHLLSLDSAGSIIDEIQRCKSYHIRFCAEHGGNREGS